MRKFLFAVCAGLAASGLGMSTASAMPTLQWVNESGDGLATVGGHVITEYRDGYYDSMTGTYGDWTVSGGGQTEGTSQQIWMLDGITTASTTFSVASTAVSFMMTGDHNDGFADFLVDGMVVLAGYNLNMLGDQSLLVSGLSNTTHTIGVRHLDQFGTTPSTVCQNVLNAGNPGGYSCPDHVAFYGGAALQIAAVPEPAVLALFGLGLAGLGVAARRRTR